MGFIENVYRIKEEEGNNRVLKFIRRTFKQKRVKTWLISLCLLFFVVLVVCFFFYFRAV